MVEKIDSDRYAKELDQLQGFNEKWKADNKSSDRRSDFRLLPLDVGYLIASQYGQKQACWVMNTKWELYKKFDTCLATQTGDQKQIGKSIEEAIETQKKIVALQKVFATLDGPKKTLPNKVEALQELKRENGELYSLVIKKVWEARGKTADLTQCQNELLQKPHDEVTQKVFERIIKLYRDGYQNLQNHSFDRVRT